MVCCFRFCSHPVDSSSSPLFVCSEDWVLSTTPPMHMLGKAVRVPRRAAVLPRRPRDLHRCLPRRFMCVERFQDTHTQVPNNGFHHRSLSVHLGQTSVNRRRRLRLLLRCKVSGFLHHHHRLLQRLRLLSRWLHWTRAAAVFGIRFRIQLKDIL